MDLVAACVELAAFWTWSLHVLSSLRSGHTLSTTHREHKTPRAQDTASTRHREHKTPRAQDTASTTHREHNTPRAQHTSAQQPSSTTHPLQGARHTSSTTHLEHDTPRARHTSSTTHLEHDPPRARPTSSTTHLEHDTPPRAASAGAPNPRSRNDRPPPLGGGASIAQRGSTVGHVLNCQSCLAAIRPPRSIGVADWVAPSQHIASRKAGAMCMATSDG